MPSLPSAASAGVLPSDRIPHPARSMAFNWNVRVTYLGLLPNNLLTPCQAARRSANLLLEGHLVHLVELRTGHPPDSLWVNAANSQPGIGDGVGCRFPAVGWRQHPPRDKPAGQAHADQRPTGRP